LITENILSSWEEMREDRVKQWDLDPQDMIREYGEVRDKWMSEEKEKWLAYSQPYDGVPDILYAMQEAGAEAFIITTKQKRFCQALLDDWGLELKPGHLFGLEDGPKTQVLRDLLQRPELAGRHFHFVEDKLGTLKKVIADPALDSVELHLAEWGYCTEKDLKIVKARILERVNLLDSEELEVLGVVDPWLE